MDKEWIALISFASAVLGGIGTKIIDAWGIFATKKVDASSSFITTLLSEIKALKEESRDTRQHYYAILENQFEILGLVEWTLMHIETTSPEVHKIVTERLSDIKLRLREEIA